MLFTASGTVPGTNGMTDPDCHRRDEQVNILLESNQIPLKQMRRKFVRCSAQATITHLKKFIAMKIFNNLEKYRDVSTHSYRFYVCLSNRVLIFLRMCLLGVMNMYRS